MRRSLALATLLTLGACSVSGPWSSQSAPVAGTPPPPVAAASIEATLQRTDAGVLKAIPPELALSFHYRRSTGSHAAFAPARELVEELVKATGSSTERAQVAQTLDAIGSVASLDVLVAAPTTPLERLDDLEQLAATGCVVGRIVVDDGGMIESVLSNPPNDVDEQIAPFTYSFKESVALFTAPGCAEMQAFKDADAVAATVDKLVGPEATFVSVVQPGHALLHDKLLWSEIEEKYREGVEEAFDEMDDAELPREYLTRLEEFVTHLNVWNVLVDMQTNVTTIALDGLDTWVYEIVGDAGTEKSAELTRRSTVGAFEANILMLSDSVDQQVASLADGTDVAVSVTFKKPDASVLLSLSGGYGVVASFASLIAAQQAQRSSYGYYNGYDSYDGGMYVEDGEDLDFPTGFDTIPPLLEEGDAPPPLEPPAAPAAPRSPSAPPFGGVPTE